ncbi:uncharacterized protein LOC134784289 [Penaeus indicus]|uniref:uncharacterized protein LOC134784289 n=1 Tax=Penaeus indicus TaxID=29960 RepID=UPI00300D458C
MLAIVLNKSRPFKAVVLAPFKHFVVLGRPSQSNSLHLPVLISRIDVSPTDQHLSMFPRMNCLLLLLVAVGLSCVMVAHASPTIGLLAGFGSLRPSQYQSKRRFHGPGYGRYHGHGYRAPRRKHRPRRLTRRG